MTKNDILGELELDFSNVKNTTNIMEIEENSLETPLSKNGITQINPDIQIAKTNINYIYETTVIPNTIGEKKNKGLHFIIFTIKYISTSIFIFIALLIGTNYSAYYNIARSYFMSGEVEKTEISILNSVQAANLKQEIIETTEIKNNEFQNKQKISTIQKYKKELESEKITFDIEITPYENRIIIPKIGKNIPLLDIKNRTLNNAGELENIFMKELENGVIRYPGSAVPGELGNTFIFGHSSNFPWMKGEYNDVFSTLDNLSYGDDIIVYYGQKKFVYTIKEKRVITPGDVSILKRNHNKKELSIMTCWPVGTTLNRLIVIGEMKEVK